MGRWRWEDGDGRAVSSTASSTAFLSAFEADTGPRPSKRQPLPVCDDHVIVTETGRGNPPGRRVGNSDRGRAVSGLG